MLRDAGLVHVRVDGNQRLYGVDTELTGTRLAMRSIRSPFPMRVTYGFEDAGDTTTEVSVRVEGDAAPCTGWPTRSLPCWFGARSAVTCARKRVLEDGAGPR